MGYNCIHLGDSIDFKFQQELYDDEMMVNMYGVLSLHSKHRYLLYNWAMSNIEGNRAGLFIQLSSSMQ
jgi:hypothetical protein